MQRRVRYAVAIRNRNRAQIRPTLWIKRLTTFRLNDFKRGVIHETHQLHELFLTLRTDLQRQTTRATVRAFDNDVRNTQNTIIPLLKLTNVEPTDAQSLTRVDHSLMVHKVKIHRLRGGEDLIGGTEFIHPLHRTIEQRTV